MTNEEVLQRIDVLEKILEKKEECWDINKSWEEYCKMREPETKELSILSRELRLIKKPEYSELPKFGDTMELRHFISNVNNGGFIDYDGYGHYVKGGKMSDIHIYPSDVKHDKVRKDFDTIVWFNR